MEWNKGPLPETDGEYWVALKTRYDQKVRVGRYMIGEMWGQRWLFEPDEGSWRAVGSMEVDGVLGWQPIPSPSPPVWDE